MKGQFLIFKIFNDKKFVILNNIFRKLIKTFTESEKQEHSKKYKIKIRGLEL
jgi:hypothetical protein